LDFPVVRFNRRRRDHTAGKRVGRADCLAAHGGGHAALVRVFIVLFKINENIQKIADSGI
jgi:hypothetical protein